MQFSPVGRLAIGELTKQRADYLGKKSVNLKEGSNTRRMHCVLGSFITFISLWCSLSLDSVINCYVIQFKIFCSANNIKWTARIRVTFCIQQFKMDGGAWMTFTALALCAAGNREVQVSLLQQMRGTYKAGNLLFWWFARRLRCNGRHIHTATLEYLFWSPPTNRSAKTNFTQSARQQTELLLWYIALG